MKQEKLEQHTPAYPQNETEHVMTEEEALAILRSPAKEFKPEELHAVGIVPADTKTPPMMDLTATMKSFFGMKQPEQDEPQKPEQEEQDETDQST